MIYCSSWDRIEDTKELYKEWIGKYPKFSGLKTNSTLIVAREEGTNKIIGAAQIIMIDDPIWDRRWGLVENVFVSEDYRRQGVARQLMRHLENQAKLFGCKFLKLTTNKEEGKGLYRALGYDVGLSFGKDLE